MKIDTPLLYVEADALGVNLQLPRTPFLRYGKVRVPFQLCLTLTWAEGDLAIEVTIRALWLLALLLLRTYSGLGGIRHARWTFGLDWVGRRYWWATVPEPKRAPPSYNEALRFSRPDYHPDPLSPAAADTFHRDYEKQFGPDPHVGQASPAAVIVCAEDLPPEAPIARGYSAEEKGEPLENFRGLDHDPADDEHAIARFEHEGNVAPIHWFDAHGCEIPAGSYLEKVYEEAV